MRGTPRRAAQWAAAALLLLVIGSLAGPRVAVDTQVAAVRLPAALDSYLALSEAAHPDRVPGTEKAIVWADSRRREPTDLTVVYLRGFSATRRETWPLAERLASGLGANLFYTRLRGHGLAASALAEATVNDGLNQVGDPTQHVLAGDIVSPASTARVAEEIERFLQQARPDAVVPGAALWRPSRGRHQGPTD